MNDGTPRPRRALTPPSADSPDAASPESPDEPTRSTARFAVAGHEPTAVLPATDRALAGSDPAAGPGSSDSEPAAAVTAGPPSDAPAPPAIPPPQVLNTNRLGTAESAHTERPQPTLGSGRRFSAASAPSPDQAEPASWREKLPPPKWLVIGGLALITVIAVVIALVVLTRRPGPSPQTTTATTGTSAFEQSLLTSTDLQPLQKAEWQTAVSKTDLGDGDPQPRCLDVANVTANPSDTRLRVFETAGDNSPVVLQLVRHYPDETSAGTALTALRGNLGACDEDSAYIRTGYALTRIGDEGVGIAVVVPGEARSEHIVLIVRTGTTISVFDFAGAQQPPLSPALASVSAGLSRLCTAGGECPSGAGAQPAPPPPGDPVGWLQPSDLPLINAGTGVWIRADNPPGTFNTSQCENMNLATVPGPTVRSSKTYLIDQDPQRPNTFGVDQAVFVFPDAGKATDFAARLRSNIAGCASRSTTGTVSKPSSVNGPGAAGPVGGAAFRVTQRTSTNSSVTYRVAVLNSGKTVTYVLSNPSGNYDFTDGEWLAVALRAGQRASQHP